jgi:pilus assembly protein Flp/PilA
VESGGDVQGATGWYCFAARATWHLGRFHSFSANVHSGRHGRRSEVIKMIRQAIKTSVLAFVKDEDGLTIVEYAVAGGLITGAVVVAFTLLGGAVDTRIRVLCNAIIAGTC